MTGKLSSCYIFMLFVCQLGMINKRMRLSSGQYPSQHNHYQTKDNRFDSLSDIDTDRNILQNSYTLSIALIRSATV